MITKFDQAACRGVAAEAEKLLQGLSALGLTVKMAGGTFSENRYVMRVEITCPNQEGKSGQQAEFERFAPMFGLQTSDFGWVFETKGRQCKIVGIKPSSRKYPVLVESNGKLFKFEAGEVKRLLG